MRNFAKMVWSGELIEHEIKNKKFEGKSTSIPPAKKAILVKKKEGDAYVVFVNQQSRGKASCANQPSYSMNPLPLIQPVSYNGTPTILSTQANNFGDNRGVRINQERTKFDPILISYMKLLPRLLENQLVARVPMESHKPSFPRWCNPNVVATIIVELKVTPPRIAFH